MNTAPVGLAQHLYRERQIRKLRQGEVALVIGVDPKTYKAWESGGRPTSHHWPAIITFLGCDPILEMPVTIPEMVSAIRRRKGLTANELGALMASTNLRSGHGRLDADCHEVECSNVSMISRRDAELVCPNSPVEYP